MRDQDQRRAIAELDGWIFTQSKHGHWFVRSPEGHTEEPMFGTPEFDSSTGKRIVIHATDGCSGILPDYLNSRDTIIPVIEKQPEKVQIDLVIELLKPIEQSWSDKRFLLCLKASPRQLCEALLKAKGLWIPAQPA